MKLTTHLRKINYKIVKSILINGPNQDILVYNNVIRIVPSTSLATAMLRSLFLIMGYAVVVRGGMEGYIVQGEYTSILKYPHSAFLGIICVTKDNHRNRWLCGSSVLNQELLLTAGHCVYSCMNGTKIVIHFGDEFKDKGIVRSARSFVVHDNYNSKKSEHDIALVRLFTPLNLNSRISRVAIMKNPPYHEPAMLAGWGLTDEQKKTPANRIKHVQQKILSREKCVEIFKTVPEGTVCASSDIKTEYAAQGDSGSALVVRGYIQVGLVSYKVPDVAAHIVIYTDVGYHYNWINANAKRLVCTDIGDVFLEL